MPNYKIHVTKTNTFDSNLVRIAVACLHSLHHFERQLSSCKSIMKLYVNVVRGFLSDIVRSRVWDVAVEMIVTHEGVLIRNMDCNAQLSVVNARVSAARTRPQRMLMTITKRVTCLKWWSLRSYGQFDCTCMLSVLAYTGEGGREGVSEGGREGGR